MFKESTYRILLIPSFIRLRQKGYVIYNLFIIYYSYFATSKLQKNTEQNKTVRW